MNGSELDHYEEQEREWKAREEAKIDIKEEIKRAMKELQCIPDVAGLSYAELCIHPDLNLPEGFKIPKFDTFGGVGNPMAHLRAYYDQLVGVGKDEALLMRLFSRSLCGEALEWFTSHETRQWPNWSALAKDFIDRFAYNVEIVHDRYSLEKVKQKSTESYREFAYRWRKEAGRVRTPMTEKEINHFVSRSQIRRDSQSWRDYQRRSEVGEDSSSIRVTWIFRIDEEEEREGCRCFIWGKKTPRNSSRPQDCSKPSPKSHQAYYPQSNHPNNHNTAPTYPNAQSSYRAPSPTFQVQAPTYQNPLPNYQAPVPNYQTNPYPRTQAPRPNTRKYQQVPPPQQSGYDPSRPSVGHDTEDCINLKHNIQDLIDQEVVSLQPAVPNVNTNPLSNHGGGNINMIEMDEDGCGTKRITLVAQEDLERAVASLSVK
ncbi:uncharacterized protein LOC107019693 [Solanum pennellii]|uniref:Uncharacterized protein LOC107019693 n=1 Tax=Solanum pennellii TaxID=28526 RepID=A0ABM1GT15_SOLPN|nr:uncharacterized protein LOC107019693 [Solanum pennellii]